MHRRIAWLAVTFLFIPSGIAQEQQQPACRVRFAVVQRQDTGTFKVRPDGEDTWGRWPEDARKWWVKDGNKKFADFCEAARNDADFVVAWERMSTTRKVAEGIWKNHREPVVRWECEPANGRSPGRCVQVTYYREVVTTDWEYHDRQFERLSLTLYRVGREPQQFMPVSSLAKEKLAGLGPGKAAFQSAMKAVRKEAKKAAATKTKWR